MNVFDIEIILIFVMFFISGFRKGIIKELVALVGIVVVFIISFSLKGTVGNLLCTFLPFFKFSGVIEGISTINILMYQMIAFMFVFSTLLGVYAVAMKISKVLQKLVLILPSKLLGALVSFVKGYIVLFAVFLVLMIPLKNQNVFRNSKLVNNIIYKTPILSKSTSNFTNSIEEVYDLASKVSNKEISTNEANLETLDIMLKYDIVTKDTIETLIKLKKLDNINNIDKILNKY